MRIMGIDKSQYRYNFTRNWFLRRNLSTFRELVYPYWTGKPMMYLEIGVYEAQSLVWMLQHVLTHDKSSAVGVDPWLMTRKLDGDVMKEIQKHAEWNIIPHSNCRLWQASSVEFLRRCLDKDGFSGIKKDSVDLCMIDGDHNELVVLDDARNVFQLVKPGGWLLFDDVVNRNEKKAHVKQGLAAFLDEHKDKVELVFRDTCMECYKKR